VIRIQGENVYQEVLVTTNTHFSLLNFDGDDLLKCFNLRNSVCAVINY
jgi:hypothetical protein